MSAESPMASSTWDGSKDADEHALPLEAQIPAKSRPSRDGFALHSFK